MVSASNPSVSLSSGFEVALQQKERTKTRKHLKKLLIAFHSSICLLFPSHSKTIIALTAMFFSFWPKANYEKGRYYPTPAAVCYLQRTLCMLFSFSSLVSQQAWLSAGVILRNCTPQKHWQPYTFNSSQARSLLCYRWLCVLFETKLAPWRVDNSGAQLIAGGIPPA